MFKINLHGSRSEWHNFPENSTDENRDCRLKIRMYPTSKSQTIMRRSAEGETLEIILSGVDRMEAFCYSFVDAEELQDSEGKPVNLDKEIKIETKTGFKKISIKEYIYDFEFRTGIPAFVLKKAGLIIEEVKREEGNLGNGPNGSSEKLN